MSGSETKQYPIALHLTAKDIKKSIDFYRNTLGFTLSESWPENDPKWCNLLLDKQSVMLGSPCSPEAAKEWGCTDSEIAILKSDLQSFSKNRPGVGVSIYLEVPDVDGFHDRVLSKGGKPLTAPKTQFYGLREFHLEDPDGYRLAFYTPVAMESCQSCGMPLKGAQPGQMYCQYCTDSQGKLKPFKEVFEGTVAGYFMAMQKMGRPEAEKAAKAHLAKMPAWKGKI